MRDDFEDIEYKQTVRTPSLVLWIMFLGVLAGGAFLVSPAVRTAGPASVATRNSAQPTLIISTGEVDQSVAAPGREVSPVHPTAPHR